MMSNEHILQSRLQEYCESGLYPMHMPGHKRLSAPAPGLPYDWDVTEVPGTDDLHAADGILKDAMDRTAGLWGSRRTWYLVNGSTCGLLAAIYACVPAGGEVIIARNCHKSVYHAVELLNLKVHWLLPPLLPEWEIFGSIRPSDVERMLGEHPAAKTLVLTSPTYEGVISDIASIARICRRHGARLIVDEAHGAHLGLFHAFPDSALHLGADIVVQSAHKTLPSLTQTALLHLGKGTCDAGGDAGCGERCTALERQIGHALDIFETSSPSYPLMASLDGCTGLLASRGEELFTAWREQIRRTKAHLAGMKNLRVLQCGAQEQEIFACDDSRFLLRAAPGRFVSGKDLSGLLRTECSIEPEMHCGGNVLLMSGCGDSPEGWDRFRDALGRLDRCLSERAVRPEPALQMSYSGLPAGETVISPAGAHRHILAGEVHTVLLADAEGAISAEYVMAYPPGIPILIPGERITAQTIRCIEYLTESGSNMRYSLTEIDPGMQPARTESGSDMRRPPSGPEHGKENDRSDTQKVLQQEFFMKAEISVLSADS